MFLAGGGSMKWLSEVVMNFFIRAVIGLVLIFFVTQFLAENHIDVNVGINPITTITSGVLGVPGVCMLYGMIFFQGF